MSKVLTLLSLAAALTLGACGHTTDQRAATGAIAGAVVAGPVGAAAGAATGAVVSHAAGDNGH
jgi:osmotically inducible lipoprotein OsmB